MGGWGVYLKAQAAADHARRWWGGGRERNNVDGGDLDELK